MNFMHLAKNNIARNISLHLICHLFGWLFLLNLYQRTAASISVHFSFLLTEQHKNGCASSSGMMLQESQSQAFGFSTI